MNKNELTVRFSSMVLPTVLICVRAWPREGQIEEILHMTNKYNPEDELNCGACGYPTCREKAVAVFRGKAEVTMCIPFLHERAESLSNLVGVRHFP